MTVAAGRSATGATVRAESLRKSYGATLAVDGVSLEIRPGEIFGLLGPNGAGKSTTIGMLSGLLRPDAGRVDIGGDDPGRPESRRRLGVAPQAIAIYPELSAEENLRFFGELYGLGGGRLRERVDWALELAGLAERRRERVSRYSGGMQRRLNLVCALVHDPEVLFLDEPTVGVDPQSRNAIFEQIEALRASAKTVLYTTHYMEEAQRLCDRVAIIDHGRLLALGTVEELVAAHGGKSVLRVELVERPAGDADPTGLGGTLSGTSLRVDTERPHEAIARVFASGVRVERLQLEPADLESVFLNLTGRRLRDA
jgi:ABC-2 type transport system ATP-binding protein